MMYDSKDSKIFLLYAVNIYNTMKASEKEHYINEFQLWQQESQ